MKRGMERLGRDISIERAKRGCFQKKMFKTRNQARDWAIVGQKKHGNAATEPYRCHLCGHWHLTKLPKNAQGKARARNWKDQ
ncbi:hypothetical protein [Hydrogenophaga sp.]|uniref:hypothetical protein n=1 Tax=Hydrogenophaga sp. TaxID=1904254 RepID=UPI003D1136B2